MNTVWNLNPIYSGYQDPAFAADIEALKQAVETAGPDFEKRLPQLSALEGLKEGLALLEQVEVLTDKLAGYVSLRQAADTQDPQADSYMGQILGIYSGFAGVQAAFRAWAAAQPEREALAQGELKDYSFLLSKIARDSRYLLPGRGEEIASRMRLSGSDSWSQMQQYLTSTVEVSYRGEKTNLSAIRNLAYDPDPQVRKDAYEAELACYRAIEAPVAYSLNSIKLETLSQCRLRGYASPLDRTLQNSDMEKSTLDAMLGAMTQYLPKFRQYLKAKAKALGYENGLPWYELFAPMGRSRTTFTTQQARDYLVELFAEFDSDLSNLVATAFDEAWIDFFPREGKAGGAFCAGVGCLKQSRILTNFGGQFGDVVTLAHELGHAFHNSCTFGHRPLNRDYSMPLAETASTFNECVVMASAISKAADKEEKLALIENQLQDACQIICDIYSRFLFEKRVFDSRETEFMNAETLKGFMLDAQRESYGDGLDENFLHPYMWVCKSHYYGASYYNFPYAFGGLFARGLYAQYEKEGAAFVPKYKKLLWATCVSTAEDTAKVAGIDLGSQDFWREALQTIADQIDLFCQLVEA